MFARVSRRGWKPQAETRLHRRLGARQPSAKRRLHLVQHSYKVFRPLLRRSGKYPLAVCRDLTASSPSAYYMLAELPDTGAGLERRMTSKGGKYGWCG